ncbi:unnamed protein product [Owenia fusiformis]|uniref:Uncharacterized protein n=1 Tax=Owenia fusiformis TaxID=6347 RepID=A0A8J1U0I4_OWEFU|nr:unnamed protein product [Owenia fusiformis]
MHCQGGLVLQIIFWSSVCHNIDVLNAMSADKLAIKTNSVLNSECPRKPELAAKRTCLKKCRSDTDCRGRNKRCLCDDVCGKSCVKPTKRCKPLEKLEHGYVEIVPYNKFSAKAKYLCDEGFVIYGQPSRICQGDGKWSGKPPSCESDGRCTEPPAVANAIHDGQKHLKVFPVGSQLSYMCKNGFYSDGFARAMCMEEGRWVGPRMTCSPRSCGHPGEVTNGRRDGNIFMFPRRVRYHCNGGYTIIGSPERICQSNGQWTGITPRCEAVKCPKLTHPDNGSMFGSGFFYRTVITFKCNLGYTLIGSYMRKCQSTGRWTGEDVKCKRVDCGLPDPLWNGYLEGHQTTYQSVIIFKCLGRTTFEGRSISTKCEVPEGEISSGGYWTNPTPKCWGQCEVPDMANGTVLGRHALWVNHNTTVSFKCKNTTHIPSRHGPATCYNGTWIGLLKCLPAPCRDRPPSITNGIPRYYSTRHGARAKYKCDTGYELKENKYMQCSYGKWKPMGRMPYCEPLYCPWVGGIPHCKVLLVGVIGKYEYRSYARKVGHNEQIEFQCDRGYKLIGPGAATCVDGQWSPEELPVCFKETHRDDPLPMYRGKRSIAGPTAAILPKFFRPEVKVGKVQGKYFIEDNLTLHVFPGSNITLDCLYLRKFGTPKWKKGAVMADIGYIMPPSKHHIQSHDTLFYEVSDTQRIIAGPNGKATPLEISLPGEWQESGTQYRLYLTSVQKEDEGRYKCYNPYIHSTANFLDVVVKEIHCKEPLVSPNVIKHGTDYSVGAIVTYSCHGWGASRTPMQVKCLSTGKWSAHPPSCMSL